MWLFNYLASHRTALAQLSTFLAVPSLTSFSTISVSVEYLAGSIKYSFCSLCNRHPLFRKKNPNPGCMFQKENEISAVQLVLNC